MTSLTPQQIETIVDEDGRAIQHEIVRTTFSKRTHGLWAGSILGLAYGAIMGALVALSPVLVGIGFTAALSMVPIVAGTFAIAGMASGATIMTAVNPPSGSAVALAKMEERRKLLNAPDQDSIERSRYAGTPPQKESFWNKMIPFSQGSKEAFSIRNAVIFAALGLIACALFMYVAPVLGGGVTILHAGLSGLLAHAPAVAAVISAHGAVVGTCMAYATCALFGATFGFDGPTIAANATQFIGDIFNGKRFSFHHAREPKKSVATELAKGKEETQTVTPEEAALLQEKLQAKEKDFTNALHPQQTDQPSLSRGI